MNWQRKPFRQFWAILLVALLSWGLGSCSAAPEQPGAVAVSKPKRGKLAEVSPPFAIQSLKQFLEPYQPQVKIVSPRADQVLEDTKVKVQLQVSDLSLYKDKELDLGPYLQVMLDNQPYTQVYDTREPLILEDLTPGTHTLRVFAVQPWHESFKNEGAFAQVSFHLFAKTPENRPAADRPLLTYNAPQGIVGAEPVLLDFYLTNAPLHLVAQSDPEDDIPDWQIRCTVNGESFTFDRWEPIYLKGLKPGQNWVQLELIDDQGNLLPNVFNSTVQLINYQPGGSDTLSKLTRGELTADDARKIVDPSYVPPAEPELILEPTPEPEAVPESPAETTSEEPAQPSSEPSDAEKSDAEKSDAEKAGETEVILEPDLTQEPTPETMPPELVEPAPVESSPAPVESAKPQRVEPQIVEPTEAKAVKPELVKPESVEPKPVQPKPTEAPPEPSPVIQPDAVKAAKPIPEKSPEVQPAKAPSVAPPASPKSLVPEATLKQLDRDAEAQTDREPDQSPESFSLPDSLKIFKEALPERGDTQPIQGLPPQPPAAPVAPFAPALMQQAKPIVPNPQPSVDPLETNFEPLKQSIEQRLQPANSVSDLEREPIPQSLRSAGAAPVEIESPVQLAPGQSPPALSVDQTPKPNLIDSVLRAPNPSLEAPAPQPEPTPKLINLFDRVKDFFEGLQKQPTELKLPFLEPSASDSTESAPTPETFNQILEDLFTPSQPAP